MNAVFSKNLGALLDDVESKVIRIIDVDQIDPDPEQPRKEFHEATIREMGEALTKGQVQPIGVIEKAGGRYLLVYGERRWRGAKWKGLPTLEAIVYPHGTDPKVIRRHRLIENLQREDMSAMDTARAIEDLVAGEGSQAAAAKAIGKSEGQISKYLSVLNLSPVAAELAGSKVTRDVETLTTLAKIERDDPDAAKQLAIEAKVTGKLTRERTRQAAQDVAARINEQLKTKRATSTMAAPVKTARAGSSSDDEPTPVRVRADEQIAITVKVVDGVRDAKRFQRAKVEHGDAQLYRGGVAREPGRCWVLFGDSPRAKKDDKEPRLQEFPCSAIVLSMVAKFRP